MAVRNTILLVEDDQDDRDLLHDALVASDGHHLISFAQGDNLLPYLGENFAAICLVVLDINLPGKNGLELANEVKNHPDFSFLPLVVLSTGANTSQASELAGLHVEVLQKPSTFAAWKEIAEKLLRYCMHHQQ